MSRIRPRTAILVSSDLSFRRRLQQTLTGLRWQVREAETGAQAWAEADKLQPEGVVVDSWLPDLELVEFVREFRASYPRVDLIASEGSNHGEGPRSPYRQELIYALRTNEDTDTAAWNTACDLGDSHQVPAF